MNIFIHIFTQFLAHLSRRLIGELIVYQWLGRPSSVICRPSSVNIFKHLLLWNYWANWTHISYGDSLGWGERIWNASTALYCVHSIRHVQGSFCYVQIQFVMCKIYFVMSKIHFVMCIMYFVMCIMYFVMCIMYFVMCKYILLCALCVSLCAKCISVCAQCILLCAKYISLCA